MGRHDPGISDDHYAALGKVASSWALFESSIDAYVWLLLGIDSRMGTCVTAQVAGSARKLDALIALARLRHGDGSVGRLNKIAEASQKLAERRNRVIHDPWIQKEGLPARMEATARKRVVLENVQVSTEEINNLYDEISKHIERLDKVMDPIWMKRPSSPDKPQKA